MAANTTPSANDPNQPSPEKQGNSEKIDSKGRRVIPTRPEANMLGTLTYLRLQEEIRAILAKRKEN